MGTAAGGTGPDCSCCSLTGSEAALGKLSYSSHWGVLVVSRGPAWPRSALGFPVVVWQVAAWSLPLRAQSLCISKG